MSLSSIVYKSETDNNLVQQIQVIKDLFDQYCQNLLPSIRVEAFFLFMKEKIQNLDRNAQVVLYHELIGIDVSTTGNVLSITAEQVVDWRMQVHEYFLLQIPHFNYDQPSENFQQSIFFIHDILSAGLSDLEMTQRYEEDVAVIKILRYLLNSGLI